MTATLTATLPRAGRCLVMGILNVTPDSFSDGGQYLSPDTAVAHGLRMAAEGADYIDVGGESTRPGADRVAPEEELRRILPVITELSRAGVAVSVDTTRAQVAQAALDAGAALVNDVSAGQADPAMARLMAETGAPWVLMHWRGPSKTMTTKAAYGNVVTDVRRELLTCVGHALHAGVKPDQIILDPGFGFAKQPEHDLALLANLGAIADLGFPVLVGTSRKRFLGSVLVGASGRSQPDRRDAATLATTILAAQAGAWAVRVHDVSRNRDVISLLTTVAQTTCDHTEPIPKKSASIVTVNR